MTANGRDTSNFQSSTRVFFFFAYSLFLALGYIYIYIEREREREKDYILRASQENTSVISHQLAPSAPRSIACVNIV